MTTPPVETTGVKIVAIADSVIVKIIGLLLFGGSGYFEYREYAVPPVHTSHLIIFGISMLFGLALALTKPVVATLSALVTVVGPYIPRVGKGDAS